MTTRHKPACTIHFDRLRKLHGPRSLAPLTGQDTRALEAFVHALDLCQGSDRAGRYAAIDAMRALGRAIQPHIAWQFVRMAVLAELGETPEAFVILNLLEQREPLAPVSSDHMKAELAAWRQLARARSAMLHGGINDADLALADEAVMELRVLGIDVDGKQEASDA